MWHFFLERDMGYLSRPEIFFGQYRPDSAILRSLFGRTHKSKFQKIDFFFEFLKMLHICDKISNPGAKWLYNTWGIDFRPSISITDVKP